MLEVTHVGALVAGLLSFFSPCVLPLVPAYLCFLGGVALDEMAGPDGLAARHQLRVVARAAAFVGGFAVVFVALGATASALGRFVSAHLDVLGRIAGVVVVLLGLHVLGVLRIPFLYRDVRFRPAREPLGLPGAFAVGLAFAFGWTPCVGPVLAVVLLVAGAEASVGRGAGLLAAYAAGIGVPFLVAALAARPFVAFVGRFKGGVAVAEKATGALLVGTGGLFLMGAMPELAAWLLATFPALGRVG
jgi:cytochrome c-type biogenesis protein